MDKVRHVRILGLCLVAVLALGAVVSSSASAKLPEWGQCKEAQEGGTGARYADPSCTVKTPKKGPHSGGYEWAPVAEHTALLRLAGTFKFETAAGKTIECSAMGSESRSLFGSAGRTPLWRLQRCHAEGSACASGFSLEEEEIDNNYAFQERSEEGAPAPGWAVSLGFLSGKGGASPSVGESFAVKNNERLFEPIVCDGPISTVWIGGEKRPGHDSFIAAITPVNEMTDHFTETLSESAPGAQAPLHLEGKAQEDNIEAFLEYRWEPIAMVGTFEATLESQLEIKATK